MRLSNLIKELLYQYECVTIPQFGAFLTRSAKAFVNDEGIFNPPRKVLSFNSLLTTNDGILAHFVAQKQNIPFRRAVRIIEKEVTVWKQHLKKQALVLPNIGEMRLNASEKIDFFPSGKINFETSAFGLTSFSKKHTQHSEATDKPKTNSIMSENENDDLMFTPNDKRENNTSLIRYVAAAVLFVMVLGAAAYYLGDQYVTNQRIKETEIVQEKIKTNVEQASFDLGTLSKIELSIPSKTGNSIKNGTVLRYSVIAGTYRSIKNARRKIESLKSKGFDAELAEVNPKGLYRVAYERFKTRKEAISLLYYLRYSLEEEAWYLEEK